MSAMNSSDAPFSAAGSARVCAKPSESIRFWRAIRKGAVLLSLASNLFCTALAQTAKEPWEELDKRVNASENISALGNELFGEQVGIA